MANSSKQCLIIIRLGAILLAFIATHATNLHAEPTTNNGTPTVEATPTPEETPGGDTTTSPDDSSTYSTPEDDDEDDPYYYPPDETNYY